MKLKELIYLLNHKKFLFVIGIVLLLASYISVTNAQSMDDIYIKHYNIIQKNINESKLILQNNITTKILIDNNSLFFATESDFYVINKTNLDINYKLHIIGIKEIEQTNNFTYLKTDNIIYKINKTSGNIEQKQYYNYNIDEIFTLFGIETTNIINEIPNDDDSMFLTSDDDSMFLTSDDDSSYLTISAYNIGLNNQALNNTIINNTLNNLKNNDTYFNGTVFPQSTNFKNDSINYFNGTVFPQSTNFRNDSIVINNNTLTSSKINKSNAGEFTGGNLPQAILPIGTNFYWNENNGFLGLGTSSVFHRLEVSGGIGGTPSTGSDVETLDVTGNSINGFLVITNGNNATPFSNANVFSGMILIDDTVSGNTGIFLTGQGAMVLVSQTGTGFTTIANTPNKINIYLNSFVVTIQNNFGQTINLNVMGFKTRKSQ